jgi:hypothetical protein
MSKDPIIAEVRRVRESIFSECEQDMDKLFQRVKRLEQKHPQRLITKSQLDALRGHKAQVRTPSGLEPTR